MSENNLNQYDGGTGGNKGPAGNGGSGGPGGNGSGKDPKKQNIIMFAIAALISLLLVSSFVKLLTGDSEKEITYNEFITMLDEEKIESVIVGPDRVYVQPKAEKGNQSPLLYLYGVNPSVTYYTGKIEDDDTLTARLLEHGVEVKGQVADGSAAVLSFLLSYVFPFLLMWVLLSFLFRKMSKGGGPMGVGKSNAKVYVQRETGITFQDVAGEDEAKESLQEVVDFLHNPGKYAKIGAKLPKGALLVGPPGTGKTLLAKAVAGEAKVPFFSLSGSDFIELYVGVGASRVRDLFKEATKNAPCIIFIDEIDAVARQRGAGLGGGHDEREQTLNQLLVEMDGFSANSGIIVMAATNRIDILDPAILRPGRFDRKITVGYPDREARLQILKVHSRNKPLADDVDLESLASVSVGFTGADLANIMNEAAIAAAVDHRQYITNEDVKNSFIREGIGVEKKSRVISEKDKLITAYHETGHAILFHELPDVGPVHIISIIPTGMGAAGYTMPLPEKDELFNTKGKMMQNIMVAMGGRIAEEIIFDDVTTGASQDIKQASQLARDMVTKYGFSKDLGFLDYSTQSDELFIGRELAHSNNFSEQTATKIDEAVKEIIDECYAKAKKIILDNKDVLERAAKALIKKEKLSREEFEAIFRGEEIDLSGKAKEEESDNTSEAADNNEHTAESNSTAKDNVTDNDNSADLNDVHDNNSNVDHDESDNNQN